MAFTQLDFSIYLVILIATIFLILLWKAVTLLLFNQSNIPGPKGSLLTGQLFELKNSKDVMQTFEHWVKIYGPIVEFRQAGVFGPTSYLISDADALKQILVSKSFKYNRSTETKEIISNKNVVAANGKEHSRMRKMINPAFKLHNLKSMIDVFHEKAGLLAKFWNDTITEKLKSTNNKECRLFVHKDLARMTLDALGECVFGYDFNSVESGDSPIAQAFHVILSGVDTSAYQLYIRLVRCLPFLRRFLKGNTRRKEALKTITEVIGQVINKKLEKPSRRTDTNARKDFLDILLEAVDEETGEGIDKDELYSQIFVFLFAGYETSSVTLTWTLFLLAQHPSIQEKLRDEIRETFKLREKTWETYESMEYLTAVVNECMRFRTPAPLFRRQLTEAENLLGYNLPAGSIFYVFTYALHRNPEYWTDPEKFNPERFLEPDRQTNPINRFAFLPFSAGPRTCIGYRFALMEIKVALVSIIKGFSFEVIPGMSFNGSMSVTYRPDPPLQLLAQIVTA